jgi:ribosome-associated toxin RatA of RatAB toxin-antitoxin module
MKTIFFITFLIFSGAVFSAPSDVQINQSIDDIGYYLTKNEADKSGLIIFDLNADINTVMNYIVDFEAYPKYINDIKKVSIYHQSKHHIDATFYVSTFFIDFQNHVSHRINKQKYSVYWQLDKSKKSYLSKMEGYWKLKTLGNKTRVYYYNQLTFDLWIPSFVESYLFEQGLFASTEWLKKAITSANQN